MVNRTLSKDELTKARALLAETLEKLGLLAGGHNHSALVHFSGRHIDHPRVRSVLQSVVIASAGLLLAASIPLARDALTDPVTIAIAAVSLIILLTTELDTLWIWPPPPCR